MSLGPQVEPRLPLWLAVAFHAAMAAIALIWQSFRPEGILGLVRVPFEHVLPWWGAAVRIWSAEFGTARMPISTNGAPMRLSISRPSWICHGV